jgi:hypothetical protein
MVLVSEVDSRGEMLRFLFGFAFLHQYTKKKQQDGVKL